MIIKNFKELAITGLRKKALAILESGLNAIKTDKIIRKEIKLKNDILSIKDCDYNLKEFKNIYVIGIGKCATVAVSELENILGDKISRGIAIDVVRKNLKYIKIYKGTHPLPSSENVFASEDIIKLANKANKNDLVIVIVSGGGSSLLCYPNGLECEQGKILYKQCLKTACDIRELNIIRKHISELKGGGLAKLLYPANVVGLIFSDIPGGHYDLVASGPTYFDESFSRRAKKLIRKYKFPEFNLIETPKDKKYFEKVKNICLVSNNNAISAMEKKALEFGLKPKILGNNIYGRAEDIAKKISNITKKGEVVLVGGETTVEIKNGIGGRNQHLVLSSIDYLKKDQIVLSCDSDGIDNTNFAGAIVDNETIKKAKKLNIDYREFLLNTDSYNFFKKTQSFILTGETGSNVSDLIISLRE